MLESWVACAKQEKKHLQIIRFLCISASTYGSGDHDHHLLCDRHTARRMGTEMTDLAWIIAGIFVGAIAISLILGKLHGTLII